MECVINNTRLKYEKANVFSYIKYGRSKIFKWYLLKGCVNDGYTHIMINKKTYKYHRVVYKMYNPEWDIEDVSKSNLIDHIDGERTNNVIENLRKATHQQNQWNHVNAKGYYWNKKTNKYYSQIQLNGKSKYIGSFDNKIDAYNSYLEAKKIHHKIE